VAAAIVDSLECPTELLACSRAYPQELRGQFELPGGKIEEGEDAVAALKREIAEELGARLRVGERVCPENGQWWPILGGRVMGVWLAEVAPGSPSPRAGASHVEARWVPIAELATLPWIG
ncbi:NUDIX domain-containing protein, partial [Mycobacterium tuberculosis]